jgi:hypothetical protein
MLEEAIPNVDSKEYAARQMRPYQLRLPFPNYLFMGRNISQPVVSFSVMHLL